MFLFSGSSTTSGSLLFHFCLVSDVIRVSLVLARVTLACFFRPCCAGDDASLAASSRAIVRRMAQRDESWEYAREVEQSWEDAGMGGE